MGRYDSRSAMTTPESDSHRREAAAAPVGRGTQVPVAAMALRGTRTLLAMPGTLSGPAPVTHTHLGASGRPNWHGSNMERDELERIRDLIDELRGMRQASTSDLYRHFSGAISSLRHILRAHGSDYEPGSLAAYTARHR